MLYSTFQCLEVFVFAKEEQLIDTLKFMLSFIKLVLPLKCILKRQKHRVINNMFIPHYI